MNNPILLNNNWYFKSEFSSEEVCSLSPEPPKPPPADRQHRGWECVNLPHTVKELPFNCFSHDETAMIVSYKKELFIPDDAAGKRIILRFDGVMAYYELYCNGSFICEHRGGYSRSFADITDAVRPGETNLLFMKVDSTERNDIPPFGYIVDFLTYGGIYRDVYLYLVNPVYISNVMARYNIENHSALTIYPEIFIHNTGADIPDVQFHFSLKKQDGTLVLDYTQPAQIKSGKNSIQTSPVFVGTVDLWDIDSPSLYTLETELLIDKIVSDTHITRTGFRHVECTSHGFYLNGQKLKLRGVNRHQCYPYVGYAMGKRVQQKDADLIRRDLACNTVRTSHYMQSEHFLDRCDEIGLLVFEEIPGWHYIGGETYQSVVMNDVYMMITMDYNHPSIFIWGVRLNESNDSPDLYSRTNKLARQLDPDRATTGVRYFKGSELKEDVYAINDFCHKGPRREDVLQNQRQVTGLDHDVPYLVSEFCGHVYPCKPWDNENVREEHARMHARVQSRAACTGNLMGALAWCAFDYQTHGDYGSGDKICYHGVMDMFRLPKFASYLYRSQKDPSDEIVLETTSVFSRGEKGDNKVAPVIIMTNCDFIEVELYGNSIGRFYPSNNYVGLAHPPIEINTHDSFWIEVWQGAVLSGFIGNEKVAERRFVRDAKLTSLEVLPDDRELSCSYADDTRVTLRFLDQAGNLLPYYPGILQVSCQGDIELRGPECFPSMGGMAAFWIRTTAAGKIGTASVTVHAVNSRLSDQIVEFKLIK